MDQAITNMLRVAAQSAEAGKIAAIAIVAVNAEDEVFVGYLDRDRTGPLESGVVTLLHQLMVAPEFDDKLDKALPARQLTLVKKAEPQPRATKKGGPSFRQDRPQTRS